MICTVILNGKKYFLDGTESFIALNDYAQRIQGKQVLIEDGKNYILDRIPDCLWPGPTFAALRRTAIRAARAVI